MENKQNFKDFLTSSMGKIILTAILIFIIYGTIILLATLGLAVVVIPIGLIMMVFGWRVLGPTNPFLMIFASGNFMIFYYIFKVILAFIIGYFVAPFQLARIIVKRLTSSEK